MLHWNLHAPLPPSQKLDFDAWVALNRFLPDLACYTCAHHVQLVAMYFATVFRKWHEGVLGHCHSYVGRRCMSDTVQEDIPDWVLEPIYRAVSRAPLEELSLDLDSETKLLSREHAWLLATYRMQVHSILRCTTNCQLQASHKRWCAGCTM